MRDDSPPADKNIRRYRNTFANKSRFRNLPRRLLIIPRGTSPAIPLQVGEQIFFATSDNPLVGDIQSTVRLKEGQISTVMEITHQRIWKEISAFGSLSILQMGWGSGIPGQQIMIYSTNHDTYTTAGVAFGSNGEMALGNDAGILMVISGKESQTDHGNEDDDNSMKESSFK